MMNDRTVHNVVRATNENQRKLFLWDSTESTSKSDACDLKEEKLCDLLAFTEHYRCLWSDYKQLLSACSSHDRNFRQTHKLSMYLYNKLYHYLDTLRHGDKEKHDDNRDFSELVALTDSIFFLYCRTTKFL